MINRQDFIKAIGVALTAPVELIKPKRTPKPIKCMIGFVHEVITPSEHRVTVYGDPITVAVAMQRVGNYTRPGWGFAVNFESVGWKVAVTRKFQPGEAARIEKVVRQRCREQNITVHMFDRLIDASRRV